MTHFEFQFAPFGAMIVAVVACTAVVIVAIAYFRNRPKK